MSQQSLTTTTGESQALITQIEREQLHMGLDRLIDSGIGGSTHDPNVAAQFLEFASKKHILLSPVMGAFRMRPGWEIAFTKLKVPTSKDAKMVYKVNDDDWGGGGGSSWGEGTLLAFHKTMLYIIRTHLGIDIKDFQRIDNGRRDYCYEFKVFAEYLAVDGQIKTLVDVGGLDLSEGSEAANKILSEARGDNDEQRRRKGEAALMRKRAKVMQFAMTNAEERVIQSYGFRSSYTKGELDSKYIVCVKPLFTGFHPDPEIQRMLFAQMLGQQGSAAAMLYGSAPGAAPALPSYTVQSAREVERVAEQPTECVPGKCLGLQSPGHIAECFGGTSKKEEVVVEWLVPEAAFPKFAGKKPSELSDPELSSLIGGCDAIIEHGPAIKHDEYREIHKHLFAEVQRREQLKKEY